MAWRGGALGVADLAEQSAKAEWRSTRGNNKAGASEGSLKGRIGSSEPRRSAARNTSPTSANVMAAERKVTFILEWYGKSYQSFDCLFAPKGFTSLCARQVR